MSKPTDYGSKIWTITFTEGDSIDICADSIEVTPIGALLAHGGYRKEGKTAESDKQIVVYAFAPGNWESFYASSALDGHPVACWG